MIPIFSSLPPKMNRLDNQGAQIGEDYYFSCLKSWKTLGFKIFTLHSEVEPVTPISSQFDLKSIPLPRDARSLCVKPLVYFSDFLLAAYEHSSGPIVITNADIELELTRHDLEAIKSISSHEFICEARIDYSFGKKDDGLIYQGGFDFFVFHRNYIKAMLENELVFGMPWWDHYVPVLLTALGLKRRRLGNSSRIFHLNHEERWDMERFYFFGTIYRKELEKIASRSDVSEGYRVMIKRLEAIERRNPHFPYPRHKNFFKNLFGIQPENPILNHMLWIAFGNLRLIEHPNDRLMSPLSLSRFLHRLPV